MSLNLRIFEAMKVLNTPGKQGGLCTDSIMYVCRTKTKEYKSETRQPTLPAINIATQLCNKAKLEPDGALPVS